MIPIQIAVIAAIAALVVYIFWDELQKIPWGAFSTSIGLLSLYIGLRNAPMRESVPASVSQVFMGDFASPLNVFIILGVIFVGIGGISLYLKYKK